jgi:hypothetical protein
MSSSLGVMEADAFPNGPRVYSRRPKTIRKDVVVDFDAESKTVNNSQCLQKNKKREEQMVLDLGQRIQVTCKECGMAYDRSDAQDVSTHEKHHSRLTRGIEWNGKQLQKQARTLKQLRLRSSSRKEEIEVIILAYDWGTLKMEATTMTRLEQVREDMDQALGAAPMPSSVLASTKIILAVSNGRVIGSLIAGSTPKGKARRIVADSSGNTDGAVFVL